MRLNQERITRNIKRSHEKSVNLTQDIQIATLTGLYKFESFFEKKVFFLDKINFEANFIKVVVVHKNVKVFLFLKIIT